MRGGDGLIGVGALVIIISGFLWITYNRLITLKQRVMNSWSQVDILLKRRADLIPNIVTLVKGYAKHEQETLEKVVLARQQAIEAETVDAQSRAEKQLTQQLQSLLVLVERYPELKADSNFLKLQENLVDTENKIAFSRQFYNDTVQKLNTTVELFPNNLVATIFGFTKGSYFNLED